MKNMKTIVIIAMLAMIGMAEIGLAQTYDSTYEGAMITNAQQSQVYLLKDGFKHYVDRNYNLVLWYRIFNSNGNRYVVFGQSDIDKIPQGEDAISVVDNNPSVKSSPIVQSPVINDPNSWVPKQGESCWSSGGNLGRCSGRAANGLGHVVGQFAKGFFGGLFSST